jgi:hypothetical protein
LTEFLNAILAFPTVLFTIPLGVVIVYWIFVLLGALDINLLGDADLDGHGHDLPLDGHGHTDLDVAGHGHAAGHLDGHGHADGHHGDHGDVDAEHAGGLAGLIQALGLGGVPVTLMLSILILAGWGFCLGAVELFGSGGWVSLAAPLVSLGLALPVTGLLIRPLRQFFLSLAAPRHRDLLGKICTITTLRVDERYGQAEVEDGGAGLIVQVRSTDPGRLNRGDRALIFDYKDEVFYVEPMNQALQRDLENLGS